MRCRQGSSEAAARELAAACGRPLPLQHGVKPTVLFSRNAEVDAVNSRVRARRRALVKGCHTVSVGDACICACRHSPHGALKLHQPAPWAVVHTKAV